MNIILIGAPLCGKGTQAEIITKEYGLSHISTGELLREEMAKSSPLGQKVKKNMEQGNLVPDNLIIEVLKEKLSSINNPNGVLLDGFPRTLFQAEQLTKFLKIDKVFYLKASLEHLKKRVAGRFVCASCNKTNTVLDENLVPCKFCGGRLTKRQDDTLEIMENRYSQFLEVTYPVVDYYKKQNLLIEICAENSVEYIFEQIKKVLSWLI